MKIPREAPVMTLPNATLFPQALLPLYIFEPRYRQMLTDALESQRIFAVAMQKPGTMREIPSPIAGLGLIRVSVKHANKTSHLILQGLARVELGEVVRYKPYRVQRIRPLATPPCDTAAADALLGKIRELLRERVQMGLPFPPFPSASPSVSGKEVLQYLDSIDNPEHVADLISYAVLARATERQTILETADVEGRLRWLIKFLLAEIKTGRKGGKHE